MDEINKYKVDKRITEHVSDLGIGGGNPRNMGFYAFSEEYKSGDQHNETIELSENFPLDNVWYTEVDELGMGPMLQPEVVGEGVLIAVCHPDIYVPETQGKKNPFFCGRNGLSKGENNIIRMNVYGCFQGGSQAQQTEDNLIWYDFNYDIALCSDKEYNGIAVVVFVNTLEDLKDIHENPYFRMREGAEFKKSELSSLYGSGFFRPAGKVGYYSRITFSQVEIPYKRSIRYEKG